MAIANWQRNAVAASMILLSGLLGGCGGTAIPLPDINSGKKTLVLLRLACGEAPNEYPGFLTSDDGKRLDTMFLGFGSVDVEHGGETYVFIDMRTLSRSAIGEGWIALIRPPGFLYLTFGFQLNPSAGGDILALLMPRWRLAPGEPYWRVEMPPGTPVVYAGTFRDVACGPTPQHNFQRDFGKPASVLRIEDEREAATTLIRRDLPTMPAPVTRLAIGPIPRGVPAP